VGCLKNNVVFLKFLFIAYDAWEQAEGIELKLDALLLRLEAGIRRLDKEIGCRNI
jgi:hypothetical protein